MTQLGFYLDASACNGCSVCFVACKDKYDNPLGVNFRKVIRHTAGNWSAHPTQQEILVPQISSYTISIACNHCEAPVCLEACPVGAITKRDNGLVVIDKNICVGCRMCECCPYDAPQLNEDLGVMTMCDGCEDLIEAGQGEQQACVAACPQRALQFGDIEEFRSKHGNVGGIEPLPDPAITHPSLVITPHRNAELSGVASPKTS